LGNPVTEVIHVKDIAFSYSGRPPLLKIKNLLIEKSRHTFVFGASGSGKSTLLELLAGVLTPQSGQIQILGKDMAQMNSVERDRFRSDHLSFIFQSFNLIPYLNVLENVKLPLMISKKRTQRLEEMGGEKQVLELLEKLGLLDFIKRPVTELSVGQQQRVAVARALVGAPEIILADEPTSALDYDHREKFVRVLFEVCQLTQSTVVFVSHDKTLEPLFAQSIAFSKINEVKE